MSETSERMDAKRRIAEALQEQANLVWAYRVQHFQHLSRDQRAALKQAARTLGAHADNVLLQALNEGTGEAEQLIAALRDHTRQLEAAKDRLDGAGDVVSTAAKVIEAVLGFLPIG